MSYSNEAPKWFKPTIISVAGVLTLMLSSCFVGTASPGPGHENVMIMKPMLFGHGGIAPEAVKTGRTWVAVTTNLVDVDMMPQQFKIHFDDLMSSDGVPLDFDAVIRLQILDSVKLITKFGVNWYESNMDKEFANRVRQAVRKHGMNETAISTIAIEAIDTEVSDSMQKYIAETKLPINLIQITVGKANPPDAIKNQRIQTAEQQQRVLTEGQKKLAEDARRTSELSRAEADNAYKNAMQLNPDQYLRLETIKMQHEACSKGGCTFITTSGSVAPVVQMK